MDNVEQFLKEVLALLPEERVSRDEAVLTSYATDLSSPPGVATLPAAVILPKTVEEVREVLVAANRHKVPVVPMGRGANIAGLAVPHKGEVVIDLRLMNRIIEINTDAAYAVVEPGVTHHQLSVEARKHGFINHLPTATGGASTMANYLMRPSGNLSAKWDPDPILSLEVVTPTGEIMRTGSASFGTAGWRARYGPFPDLTGLFVCSYGTLGIVTKAAVKLFDRGEEERLLVTKFDSLAPALEYMKLIVRRKLADSVTFWCWVWNIFHTLMASRTQELPPEMMKEDQRTPPPGIPFGIASARLSGYKEVVDVQERTCIRLARELGGRLRIAGGAQGHAPRQLGVPLQLLRGGDSPQTRRGIHHAKGALVAWVVGERRVQGHPRTGEVDVRVRRQGGKAPYMFRVLPFNQAREFFFAFVILIPGDLREQRDYMLQLRKSYANFYYDFLKKHGAVMFRFRQDPNFLSQTGPYGELLRKIEKVLDPNNIMHPGVNLF